MDELKLGSKGSAKWTVTEEMTAAHCQSGFLPVFATPVLTALMECAACNAIAPFLGEGATSVGAEISLRHSAPSAVGATVEAVAVLTGIDGRALSFEISAWDEHGVIGSAEHKRFIVDAQRFMQKLSGR